MGAATEAMVAITAGAGGLLTTTVLDSLSKALSSRWTLERFVPRLRRKPNHAAMLRLTTSNGTIEIAAKSLSSIDVEALSQLLQTEQERVAAEKVVEDYLAQVEDTGQVNS